MPSAFFRSSFRTLGSLLILSLSYVNVFSQIIIKERVAIDPKVQPKQQPLSIPSGPLLTLDGMTDPESQRDFVVYRFYGNLDYFCFS